MNNKSLFLEAIHNKRIVKIKFNSKEKWVIVRYCIPFDFWPSRKFKDSEDRYHFWDLDSPEKKHNLSILPIQLLEIWLTDDSFFPWDYVKWQPNWFIQREWGKYS